MNLVPIQSAAISDDFDNGTGLFAAAVRATRMPMLITNPRQADNPVVFANDAFCRLTGYSHKEILGNNCRFLQGAETDAITVDRIRTAIAAIAAREPIEVDIRNHTKDGRLFWNRLLIAPVYDANGTLAYFFSNQFDVTSEREDLDARTRELAKANDRLRAEGAERERIAEVLRQAQKMQALGQLAAGIAHDFNNILQTVSGATALIERRPEDKEKVCHLARVAANAAARGASITQRLLSFARHGELHSETIVTAAFIESAREVLAHTLGTTITVQVNIPSNLPSLTADRGQLDTAVINIGTNARDAMVDGGTLTLSAAAEHVGEGHVNFVGLAPGNYVRLSIADDGVGIDAATLARVSEPFFTTKPTGQGTGLGLAMVRGFAEQSGGAFSITSTPGAGTTVMIWLRAVSDDVPGLIKDAHVERVSPGLSARILLVDDDPLVLETMAETLENLGFATLVASSGQEALALLASGEMVDAMVSDLSMPDMNGIVTIDKARALRPSLPCFLLTGYIGERAALSSQNAFTLLRKPMTGRALAAEIEAQLVKALV